MTPRVSLSEFNSIKANAAARKAKRAEKAGDLWPKKAKRPTPKKKKPSWKSMVRNLDKSFSQFVRERDNKRFNGQCPFCGIRPIECCFHFITRAKHSVRWDVGNAVGSCMTDNYKNEFNPHPYVQWYLKCYGQDSYDALIERSNKIAKFSRNDLLEIEAGIQFLVGTPGSVFGQGTPRKGLLGLDGGHS